MVNGSFLVRSFSIQHDGRPASFFTAAGCKIEEHRSDVTGWNRFMGQPDHKFCTVKGTSRGIVVL